MIELLGTLVISRIINNIELLVISYTKILTAMTVVSLVVHREEPQLHKLHSRHSISRWQAGLGHQRGNPRRREAKQGQRTLPASWMGTAREAVGNAVDTA